MKRIAIAFAVLASSAALPASANKAAGEVTFTKDVAPILFAHCASCHRPGEVAPFPLLTYKDAKKRASQIADVVGDRFMPPWRPEKGHGQFVGERRLSDEQVAVIQKWANTGAVEGDPAALPAAPTFPEGWQLGEPDLVLKMTEAYTLKAEGRDIFRVFVIPSGLTEDKYVRAVEFRPENRKIVHHALLFLDSSGAAKKLDEADAGPGYGRGGGVGFVPSGGLGGWAPGYTPRPLPSDVGRPMRKGSDLVIQVHFHPSGKEEIEQSSIGIYFHKELPKSVLVPFPRAIRRLNIPAGEKSHEAKDTFTVPTEVTIIGLTPHAHLLCKEVKVDATLPDGTEKPLIWIKEWDWDWQDEYFYTEQIKVPAGTKVSMLYRYDNSAGNPRNPSDPPKPVRWGEQTTDEMAITFFQVIVPRELVGLAGFGGGGRRGQGENAGAPESPEVQRGREFIEQMLLRRFDTNKNGKIDPEEQEEIRKTLGQ